MKIMVIMEISEMDYDKRHGGPWDRGSADSYYGRQFEPHFYVENTGTSPRVEMKDMTAENIVAYTAGYNYNEKFGDKKDWG